MKICILTGTARILWVLPVLLLTLSARADHALDYLGRGLFNVIVDDNVKTSTTMLRVRYTNDSFMLDFKNNKLLPLLGREAMLRIPTHITTSTRVGKVQARELMVANGWSTYEPVRATPTPRAQDIQTTETKSRLPFDADFGKLQIVAKRDGLSEKQRVTDQINLFIKDQQKLGKLLNQYFRIGMVTLEVGKERRKELLELQEKLFLENFDVKDSDAREALKYFEIQKKSVLEKGFYSYE